MLVRHIRHPDLLLEQHYLVVLSHNGAPHLIHGCLHFLNSGIEGGDLFGKIHLHFPPPAVRAALSMASRSVLAQCPSK